jgi:subtilisin family serine protease
MNKRIRLAGLGVAGLVLGVLAPTWATSTPSESGVAARGDSAKVAPRLAAKFDQRPVQDFWVRFADDADTSAARDIDDWSERGWYVYNALTETADASQASVRGLLDERGVDYESYWIVNAIRVEHGTAGLADELVAYSSVQRLIPTTTYSLPKPIDGQPQAEVNSVEWGVANINADDVWAQYGDTGQGITVASVDTGVQFDHPALVRQYRGNNGDGTFTHDYNWFDAADACDTAGPCDSAGHGTHTMGTMVGDDGQGNQVGVAPGAKWIEANGCCPSDRSLMDASQWMLAPTRVDGTDPDPAMRPNIVNNSWGTTAPTNEPFLEDIQQAWADAGIFGSWSNGNSGPGCTTAGSPGSRTLNYSTGAYDINNTIAGFSSRGPGQDGQIKPNISAPGVNVRSSWPGGTFNTISGTSMAAPHVAGAVALLWSEYPDLVGDIAGTRLLLDLTARDTEDLQCGGTTSDNNVYGEGRLDALALMAAGAAGLGELTGTVTDETAQPLADASVTVEGPVSRSTRTRADGTYTLPLVAGSYEVTVSGPFGYTDDVQTVQIARETTLQHDATLTPTDRVNLTGVIRDGSGLGSPLPATVVVTHTSGFERTAETDPDTGEYTIDLVPNASYSIRVTSPGYEPHEAEIMVGPDGLVQDVALTVSFACTAPGYQLFYGDGLRQAFEGNTKWSVTNVDPGYPGYDNRPGWTFTDSGGRTNQTGSSGDFAIVDSDHLGQHHVQDTYLTSPVLNTTGRENTAIEFDTDLVPAVNSTATVELSTDGGQTWTTTWQRDGFPGAEGPSPQALPLPAAADHANVQVRFHYTGQWSGWWAIDDIFLGDRTCTPIG